MHLSCKLSVAVAAMMSDTRGLVLGLDVGGQLRLELEHGAALLRLALEVGQLVQGLVRVHPLEVASVKECMFKKSTKQTTVFLCATLTSSSNNKTDKIVLRVCYLVLRQ